MYPDKELAATSRYGYEEICATLDQWNEAQARFEAVLNDLPDYYALPADIQKEIDWLEPVSVPVDGTWHRAGNTERFPVLKWRKIIKQHDKLASRIKALM
jgi:hypothetical protein